VCVCVRACVCVCKYNVILQNCMVKWIHFQNVIKLLRVSVNINIEITVTYKICKIYKHG
jgi:hypothetical protein